MSLTNLRAQTEKSKEVPLDTSDFLDITGKFDGTVSDFKGAYTATLIQHNTIMEKQTLNVKKSFDFTLKKNMLYAIRIEKEGFISKTISVSTYAPNKIDGRNNYEFILETNLLSQDLNSHFNDDDIDFPVALVSYTKGCDCFEFNKAYTSTLIARMINSLLFGSI
jgi:hypothetical protein